MSTVTASDQVMSFASTFGYPHQLAVEPHIFRKVTPPTGETQFVKVETISGSTNGGRFYTDVVENDFGHATGYYLRPMLLTFTSAIDVFSIQLSKSLGKITYSSSPNAEVYADHLVFSDIIGAVGWKFPGTSSGASANSKPPEKVHDLYRLQEGTAPEQVVKSTTGSRSKSIPANELFSLLFNANLYFKGPIYQLIDGRPELIDHIKQDARGTYGGYFSLTPDIDKPYPEGKTKLEISDGFSQSKATVTFEHDAATNKVVITVTPNTFEVCELRDLSEAGWPVFPNTLCVAL